MDQSQGLAGDRTLQLLGRIGRGDEGALKLESESIATTSVATG
jgi:hypothetical protein